MIVSAFALLTVLQQAQQQPTQVQAPPSPVARLVIHPKDRTMIAGDTLRLRVEALDASGRPVPNAQIRFAQAGAGFEGVIEADGLIRSGSTGVMPVGIAAVVPGAAPVVERVQIRMVPGPAARVEVGCLAPDLEEDVLSDVLGTVRVNDDPPRHAIDRGAE